MIYRNPTLLALAQEFPHCMACGTSKSGCIVMAHSNQLRDGKGIRLKAHDYRVAALCDRCHDIVDGRLSGALYTIEYRTTLWEIGHRATLGWLFENGYISIHKRPQNEHIA